MVEYLCGVVSLFKRFKPNNWSDAIVIKVLCTAGNLRRRRWRWCLRGMVPIAIHWTVRYLTPWTGISRYTLLANIARFCGFVVVFTVNSLYVCSKRTIDLLQRNRIWILWRPLWRLPSSKMRHDYWWLVVWHEQFQNDGLSRIVNTYNHGWFPVVILFLSLSLMGAHSEPGLSASTFLVTNY